MSNWKRKKIGEILNFKRGYDLPSSSRTEGKIPIISSAGISDYHNEFKKKGEGIVTGRYGTLGEIFYINGKYWPLNTTLYVTDFKGNYPKFIYYFLKTLKLERFNGAAAVPGLDRKVLHKVEVLFNDDVKIQKKIASILSSYDELIENNEQRISLLEEMAEEIYKEWFVRLRFPGYENTKIVDGLPEGFLKSTLPDYIDFLEGPGLLSSQYRDEGIRYLNIRVMGKNDLDLKKAGFIDKDDTLRRYSHFLLKENDHIVSSSGTIGRVVSIRESHLPLCLNTSIIRFRPKTDNIGKWQLKHYLKSNLFQGQIESFAIGAAQANFGPTHLKITKVMVPTLQVGINYEKIVSPLEEEIKILLEKNLILQETRDLLLPRLISGKLSVEHLVEKEELMMVAEGREQYN